VARASCSPACGNASRRRYPREKRACRTCGGEFVWSAKPHSNSAGTYCSIACRDEGYAMAGGYHGHRPRWRGKRNRFFEKNNDFCARCGRRDGRLPVHHVVPYRVSRDDSEGNLLTLCPRCHAAEEVRSTAIAAAPPEDWPMALAVVQAQYHDLWHLHQGRRLLQCKTS
jgi:hypothetical protein